MIIPYPCVSLTSDAAATMKIRTDFAARLSRDAVGARVRGLRGAVGEQVAERVRRGEGVVAAPGVARTRVLAMTLLV